MKDIKGAIFDLDGTLVDSMTIWGDIAEDYLKSHGVTPHDNLRIELRPKNTIEECRYYIEQYGLDLPIDEVIRGRDNMMLLRYLRDVKLKTGVREVLEALKKRGIRMCIATATERNLAEPAIKAHGIEGYFESIFTCSEEDTSKKYPDIFLKAAKSLGTLPHETLVVEDALYASKTAKNTGFVVAGVYDLASDDLQDELKATCDYYFVTMDEMLAEL